MSGIDYARRERIAQVASDALFAPELVELEAAADYIRAELDFTNPVTGEDSFGTTLSADALAIVASNLVLASRLRRAQSTPGGQS